jgi:serine/threonine protein kinase
MTARVGQQLGNYRLMQLLERGNFAEVYLGAHMYLNTQAAIKVLYGELADQDMEGFLTEARTIARLRHPHIIQVLEFGVEDTTPFLVMDYAPGGNLRQHHPKGTQLSLETILSYVRQIANALQYAHQEQVIHRDIKPENMLLGRNNEVLLSDFGIAVLAQSFSSRKPRITPEPSPIWPPSRSRVIPALPAISMPWASSSMNGSAVSAPFLGRGRRSLPNISLFLPHPCMRRYRSSRLRLSRWC